MKKAKRRYSNNQRGIFRKLQRCCYRVKLYNDYELLIAIILSAQCTDKRVNIITPNALFLKYQAYMN